MASWNFQKIHDRSDTGLPVTEREEGTLVTTVMAVQSHYGFVRVHDAEKNRRAIKMTEVILARE